MRMLAIAERAIAADSGCSRGWLLRPRISARPRHLMAGSVHVMPAITRLLGKNNAATNDEYNCNYDRG